MTPFQELVLISLGKRDRFSRRLTEADWALLYKEAQRQSLVGVLLTGVEKVVALGETKPKFLIQWIAQGMALESRNRLLDVRCKEITDIFRELGLRSCVLKGQGVARLYPNPLRRQCGDIDLWVEGNRDEIYKELKAKWRVGETVVHHADVEVFADALTEIHFIPSFTYSPFLFRRYKFFFKKWRTGSLPIMTRRLDLPILRQTSMLSFHHVLYEGIGLRQLLDYYFILRRLDGAQRRQVIEELKYLGLARFAEAVMYVEQQVFGLEPEYCLCQPNEKTGKRLLEEIELAGNFGQFDQRNQQVNRKSKLDVYLHNVKRNFVFFGFAPSEVLWAPIWKPCHFVWRKTKGYS